MKKGWETKKLGEVCNVFADGDWIEKKDQSSEEIRLVQTGNVGNGVFKDRREKARYISEKTFKRLRCTEIMPGDCLISRLPDPVGRSCIIPDTGQKMITAVDCTIIRFQKETILSLWFVYYSLSQEYQNQINKQVSGATRQRISRNNLGLIAIPLPPLLEQKRIVGILDKAFAAISTAKANAEKNLQNAHELFESYLQGVFANSGDGWEVKKLGEVCDISTGKWDANHAVDNGEFRFFTCAREPKLCDTKRFSGECLVLPGNGVNVGDVYYYKGDFDAYQRTYVISKIKPYPKYLFYHMLAFWKKRNLNKQYGSATNFLKIGNFTEYEIPLPPLPEQRAIVANLDTLSAETKKLETIYQKKLADLEELKKSVLQKAFNGELP